ncbi:MAG: MCE family protein [Gammaproteobacteria bacterium]|nr:MCE family protein [Gammaproteobacteria bacterium]
MKHDDIPYLAVGGFTLAVLIALAVTLALITGRTGATDRYYVEYAHVAGLARGTPVSFEGYPLGRVADIAPRRDGGKIRYRLELAVQHGWGIPKDSVAQVVSSGLLSSVSIDIQEGVEPELLAPGATIAGRESVNLLAAVDSLANRLNNAAGDVEAMLGGRNRENVGELLENLAQTSRNFQTLTTGLTGTQQRLDELLGESNDMLKGNRPEIDRAVADLRASLAVIAQYAGTVSYNLEGTSRNLLELSRALRENPGLLLNSTSPQDPGEAK